MVFFTFKKTGILILYFLQRSTITPLSRIHKILNPLIRKADKAMFKARHSAGKYCIYSAKTI